MKSLLQILADSCSESDYQLFLNKLNGDKIMKNSKTTKQQYSIQIPNSMENPEWYTVDTVDTLKKAKQIELIYNRNVKTRIINQVITEEVLYSHDMEFYKNLDIKPEKPLFYYQFNSGRQYTESGQIIQCKIIPEFSYSQDAWIYSIYFYDKSRMIAGYIIINYIFDYDGISDSKLEKEILDFYDRLSYDSNISFSDKNIKEIISHFKKEV